MDPMAEDSVLACVDLVGRTGARDFEIPAGLLDGRWNPGCDAPPLSMPGSRRGDHAAMNRALRRRLAKGGR